MFMCVASSQSYTTHDAHQARTDNRFFSTIRILYFLTASVSQPNIGGWKWLGSSWSEKQNTLLFFENREVAAAIELSVLSLLKFLFSECKCRLSSGNKWMQKKPDMTPSIKPWTGIVTTCCGVLWCLVGVTYTPGCWLTLQTWWSKYSQHAACQTEQASWKIECYLEHAKAWARAVTGLQEGKNNWSASVVNQEGIAISWLKTTFMAKLLPRLEPELP